MIYNSKNKASNRFQPHMLPTARKLFERFGFSKVSGHPDNTDPYKFSDPQNPQGALASHHLQATKQTLEREAYFASHTPEHEEPSAEGDDLPQE